MKLTLEQINQLKQWISKRGFTHLDVQLEIIDHVACAIEEKLEKDPSKSLEVAFKEVHSSFGVMGFSSLEESISKRVQKQVWQYTWKGVLHIFTSYKICFLVLYTLLALQVFNFYTSYFNIFLLSTGVAALLSMTVELIYHVKKNSALKRFMTFAILGSTYGVMGGIIPSFTNLVINFNLPLIALTALIIFTILLMGLRHAFFHMMYRTKELQRLYNKLGII
jgi:hypothetical protein